MSGLEALLPALIIALLFCVAAFIVTCVAVIRAFSQWRRGYHASSVRAGIVAVLCAGALIWFITPSQLPRKIIVLDLTHPLNLSGVPSQVRWRNEPSLDIPGIYTNLECWMEGRISVRVTLPGNQVIQEEALNISIARDEMGVREVYFTSFSVPIRVAAQRAKPVLAALLNQSINKESYIAQVAKFQDEDSFEKAFNGNYMNFKLPGVQVNYSANNLHSPVGEMVFWYHIQMDRPKKPVAQETLGVITAASTRTWPMPTNPQGETTTR